jgi:hypothetical protein
MMAAASTHEGLRTFDTVELTDDDERKSLSFEEFMAIPLDRRVRWLLTGQPRFFQGEMEISRREALRLGR